MQHNEIASFVPSITTLVKLKEMDVSQVSLGMFVIWIWHVDIILQNFITSVPGYAAIMPALIKCNLEGNPIEHLDTRMSFTLTQFNLKSATEMVRESWRHQEQGNRPTPT